MVITENGEEPEISFREKYNDYIYNTKDHVDESFEGRAVWIIDGECFPLEYSSNYERMETHTKDVLGIIRWAKENNAPIIYLSSQNLDAEATNEFYNIGLENTLHLLSEIIVAQYEKAMIIRIPRKVFNGNKMRFDIDKKNLIELIYYTALYLHSNNKYNEKHSVFDYLESNQDFEDFVEKYKLISIGFPKTDKPHISNDSLFKPNTSDFIGHFTFLENAEMALHMMNTLNMFLNRNMNALSDYI